MEIKITSNQILKVLQVFSWIIFIGLCVEAGAIVVNTIISLFINPDGVHNFWEGADYLSGLFQSDRGHFAVIAIIMTIIAVLKAILFYLIVKLFVAKKLNIANPFSSALHQFIQNIAYLALGIGLFSYYGLHYSEWLTQKGAETPNLRLLNMDGADVWLFMAVTLFVIAQIVKRGIEIQNENDLTI
ncbi:DUF2975 domain-containing protein [Flavobacterium supellecticarium]|uniref:DUF2975 domain-containing protein n=1 Tax=Flavobacterium supellecticarium TaxID=2565924 RepID=A0A4S4A0G9_9FLAO|nr:DUF2975 domain-containing protein [Flavobacterium supellecticarium]THF51748.1 DUF2975 domain-containing protein [Flavobacterium supellecticarium]